MLKCQEHFFASKLLSKISHLKNKNKIDKCEILGEPFENSLDNTEKVNYSKFSKQIL